MNEQRARRANIARAILVVLSVLAVSGQTRAAAHAGAARLHSPHNTVAAPRVVRPLTVPDAGIVRPGSDTTLYIPRPSVPGYVPISVTVSVTSTAVVSFDGKALIANKHVLWSAALGATSPSLALHVVGVANGAAAYTVVADAANTRFVGHGTIFVGSSLQGAPARASVGTGYMTRLNLVVTGALPRAAKPAILSVQSSDPSIASVVSYVPVTLTVAQPVVPVFISGNRSGVTTLTVQTGIAISNTATMSATGTLQGSTPLSNTVALQVGTVLSTTVTLSVVAASPPPSVFSLQTNPISVTANFAQGAPSQATCAGAPPGYSSMLTFVQSGDQLILAVPADLGEVSFGGIKADGSFALQRGGEVYTGRLDKTGSGFADDTYSIGSCTWTYHATFTPLPST